MQRLVVNGIEKRIYDKYFGQLSLIKCETPPFVPVGVDIMMIVFKILLTGSSISFIILLLELRLRRILN